MSHGRMEKGYSLNISNSNINRRRGKMTIDGYFAWILVALSGLIFTALVLGFLYMVYGKEEIDEED